MGSVNKVPDPAPLRGNQRMYALGLAAVGVISIGLYWRESYKQQIQHPAQGLHGNQMSSALLSINKDEVEAKNNKYVIYIAILLCMYTYSITSTLHIHITYTNMLYDNTMFATITITP